MYLINFNLLRYSHYYKLFTGYIENTHAFKPIAFLIIFCIINMARYVIAVLIVSIFKKHNWLNTQLFKLSVRVINFLRKKNFLWLKTNYNSKLPKNKKIFWDQLIIIIITLFITTIHNILLAHDYYLIMTFFTLFFTYLFTATYFRLKLTFEKQNLD